MGLFLLQVFLTALHFVLEFTKFKVASWVEIKDAKGTVLLSGTQEAGTEQTVSGELPLKVKVGNASQVEATWKGQPYDLKAAIVSKSKDVAKIDALN